MGKRFFVLSMLAAALLHGGHVFPQNAPQNGVYVIFDGSGSMWQKLPDQTFKIEAAKQVLQEFVSGDFSGFELAVRVYGHRRKGDCRDSELAIPFSAPQTVISKLSSFMGNINPTGKTPITYSFREALKDFGKRSGEIILISDGIETCDEDPCALVREWQETNVKIRVHVVGLGLDEKSKGAMRCISEAAGTEYHDANSASELSDGLKKIHEKAVPASFKLQGFDANGNEMRIKGILSRAGQQIHDIESHRRYVIEAGEYELTAGIETRNGRLYRPAQKTVQVTENGETTARVEVQVPPSVRAKFVQMDQTKTGSLITAFQGGKEVFRFRWKDEVYVDEGTYEFRAKPNPENDLTVTETFAAGEHKQIVFEMTHTVRARFKLVASGSKTWFRQNYELWQDGEKKYGVHANNGALVVPGTYELHMNDPLTPFVKENVIITEEDEQDFQIEVPVGHVTVVYQKSDGTRDEDERCFIGPGPTGGGKYRLTGRKHPLVPGVYNVSGWRHKGEYDRVVFEVEEGRDIEVVLRAKK